MYLSYGHLSVMITLHFVKRFANRDNGWNSFTIGYIKSPLDFSFFSSFLLSYFSCSRSSFIDALDIWKFERCVDYAALCMESKISGLPVSRGWK